MRSKSIIAIMAVLIVSGVSVLGVSATSHNDAPLIAEDRLVNNTDVYAFVSPSNPNMVTLISNYIPMVEPGDGPTHSRFASSGALYEIMVDVDGDAREDLTYQFNFNNEVANGNTFLYNTGPVLPPATSGDPSSPYQNLNVQQFYTLTEIMHGNGYYDYDDDDGKRKGKRNVLLKEARVAPANVGPQSTPDYEALANAAIHAIEFDDDMPYGRAFAGPRDEGFYIDLMAAFDLLGGFLAPQRDPADTFSGFNVYTVAVEIPKAHFEEAGDTDGIIGVWSSASRKAVRVLRKDGKPEKNGGPFQQVSRLGNPLVNELLLPLDVKDKFNASDPKQDARNGFDDLIVNPGDTQGGAALIPLLDALITDCTPVNGRFDLELALLTGIPGGVIPGFLGNRDTQQSDPVNNPTVAEMLRLNYNIEPPSGPLGVSPDNLGLLGGNPAGFPNGRAVGDDIADIYLKAGAGGILQALGLLDPDDPDNPCNAGLDPLSLSDGVQSNDAEYLTDFPYLAHPHEGYRHEHEHGGPSPITMLGIGSGLLGTGIAIGTVYTFRRRRNSVDIQ